MKAFRHFRPRRVAEPRVANAIPGCLLFRAPGLSDGANTTTVLVKPNTGHDSVFPVALYTYVRRFGFVYICMYVYVCIYMYVCVYMYVLVYMYVCMYVRVYMYVRVCKYICVCMYVRT
jgi:hypothetical protein